MPFKLAYRVAAAGAALSAGAAYAALILSEAALLRRKGRRLSVRIRAGVPLSAAALFSILYYPPHCRRRAGTRAVFLTFDDGPDPAVTPGILDVLEAHQARASFFLLGARAARRPDIVSRIIAAGHTIGIHGCRHEAVTLHSSLWIRSQIHAAAACMPPEADIRWYRPPYGLRGPGVAAALRQSGLKLVLWTLDSGDYVTRNAESIQERIGTRVRAGDVILLHDAGAAGEATLAALPGVLALIQERGLAAQPLS